MAAGRAPVGRADVHALAFASAADLWYTGGGAFQSTTFGFAGRPVSNTKLANLYDVSGDFAVNPRAAIALYYGYATGGAVPQAIYSSSEGLHFAYVELLVRF